MNTEEIKESSTPKKTEAANEASDGQKPFRKWEKSRFDFALYYNDSLICKRNFQINGYIEKSMQTLEFKNELDKMVELIHNDLVSKSRIYTWAHYPEFKFVEGKEMFPEWEPEIMLEALIPEGEAVFKFAVLDNGVEVASRSWDGRYFPSYVRKNVDLTNRQVRITRGERTNTYDKEKFFAEHEQLFGELYVLKQMIGDKEDLVPKIQNMIYEVCSSYDGYFEKLADYHTTEEYNNRGVKRDADGNPIVVQRTVTDADGNEVPVYDAFGNPWMVPVLEDETTPGKSYSYNLKVYNSKVNSEWGAAVAEKTKQYMSELYVSPRDKFAKRKNEN